MNRIFRQNSVKTWLRRGVLSLLVLALALPLAGVVYQAIATGKDRKNFPAPGWLVDVGDYKLHLHCIGTGSPTVVLEGGLGGTSLDWSLVQPGLAEKTRVCAYDRAGLGWSEVNPAYLPRTSRQIAAELHTLLKTAGIPAPYVLAGLSAGGMHVQVFAAQYPDEVAGLVLVDPTPAQFMAGLPNNQRQGLLPDPAQFRLMQILEALGLMRLLPIPGSAALAGLSPIQQQSIRAVALQTGAARALYAEAAGIEQSIWQTASLEPFPPEVPLTVIRHGIPVEPVELEPLVEASLRELAGQSAHGRFVIAENSGHYVTFDRPDVVIEEAGLIGQRFSLAAR